MKTLIIIVEHEGCCFKARVTFILGLETRHYFNELKSTTNIQGDNFFLPLPLDMC